MNAISLKEVRKSYGATEALKGINITIEKGAIYGLLGPNGAGKTTAINIISGLVEPDNGEVKISVNGNRMENLGVVPQETALYEELTVKDNLKFFASLYDIDSKSQIEKVSSLTNIQERMNDKVSTLSGGLKRRLNLAIGIINNPQIILMDEPTVGIDTQSRNFIYENILRLKQDGKTIIYTTHYLEEAEKLCDFIAIIDKGEILSEGTLKELLNFEGEIEITFNPQDKAEEILSQSNFQYSSNNGIMRFKSDNSTKTIIELSDFFRDKDINIEDIKIKRPSLEELFLKLTGKQLRE